MNQTSLAPYLNIHGLEKSYPAGSGYQTVLRGVSLQVYRGERLALLGQSGSGKSTLLNLIAGIDTPDSGGITVDGVSIGLLTEKDRTLFRRRHIGFIYQSFNLIQTLTALENVQLPLQLNGADRRQAAEQSARMLDRVGLGARGDAFADQLSGGEQQRVAIARAMVHRPALVLADEHTGNLDAETGASMMGLFNEIAEETSQTVVMVTHSSAVAATANRVALITDGRIAESDLNVSDALAW